MPGMQIDLDKQSQVTGLARGEQAIGFEPGQEPGRALPLGGKTRSGIRSTTRSPSSVMPQCSAARSESSSVRMVRDATLPRR